MLGFVNNSRDFAKQNSADALSHKGSFKVDGAPRDSMLDTVDESDCKLEHNHFTRHARTDVSFSQACQVHANVSH